MDSIGYRHIHSDSESTVKATVTSVADVEQRRPSVQ